MDISAYVAQLQRSLETAAQSGSPKAQEAAKHLVAALEPAARLAMVELLSDAAEEISQSLSPGSVELRVRGKDVGLVVVAPATHDAVEHAAQEAEVLADVAAAAEDDSTARTTIRLPDSLKERAQVAATAQGVSLNTWLVRAVSLYLKPGPKSRRGRSAAYYTGWTR